MRHLTRIGAAVATVLAPGLDRGPGPIHQQRRAHQRPVLAVLRVLPAPAGRVGRATWPGGDDQRGRRGPAILRGDVARRPVRPILAVPLRRGRIQLRGRSPSRRAVGSPSCRSGRCRTGRRIPGRGRRLITTAASRRTTRTRGSAGATTRMSRSSGPRLAARVRASSLRGRRLRRGPALIGAGAVGPGLVLLGDTRGPRACSFLRPTPERASRPFSTGRVLDIRANPVAPGVARSWAPTNSD